jgi:hypothetical protein
VALITMALVQKDVMVTQCRFTNLMFLYSCSCLGFDADWTSRNEVCCVSLQKRFIQHGTKLVVVI